MRILITVLCASLFLAGCSANRMWYGSDKARLSWVKLEGKPAANGDIAIQVSSDGEAASSDQEKTHLGTVISWSPEFNAAYITDDGKGCIQPAIYARLGSGNVSFPAEVISAAGGDVSAAYSQALEHLSKVTNQSTFMSIGFYGLCQLEANGGLSKADTAKLGLKLLELAQSVPTSRESAEGDETQQDNKTSSVAGVSSDSDQ